MKITYERRSRFLVFAAAALSLGAADPPGVDPLTLPLSPGSVALLVERSAESAVHERWKQALKSPSVPIRAAAARVIPSTRTTALVPDLREALTVEPDPAVAFELASGVAALDATSDSQLVDTIRKASNPLRSRLLSGFCHGARGRFLAQMPAWLALGLSRDDWAELFRDLTERSPGDFLRLAPAVLRDGPDERWLGLLDADRRGVDLASPLLLMAATQSVSSVIRKATLLHILGVTPQPTVPRVSLDDAVATDDPIELVTRELLRRGQNQPAMDISGALSQLGAKREELERLARRSGVLAIALGLRPDERKLLAAALGMEASALELATENELEARRKRLDAPGAVESKSGTTIRTAGPFPAGYVADVLALTGCKSDGNKIAAALAKFGSDGWLKGLTFQEAPLNARCLRAARVLLGATRLEAGDQPTALLVLPVQEDFLVCLAAQSMRPDATAFEHGAEGFSLDKKPVSEPKKTRHVNPIYPMNARYAREQGTVILEAVISETGCISALKVIRGVTPSINTAAFLAVSRWEYSPTLLYGKPVAVIMTVTVNFKLN